MTVLEVIHPLVPQEHGAAPPLESAQEPARWWWGALLVVLAVVPYIPAFNAGFVWQDDQYITDNVLLRDWPGLGRLWLEPSATPRYQPVTYTAFWLEHHLWGNEPLGYHAVSVAFHALNGLLLWTLLRRLSVPGAWLAAALFLVHPMQVQAVAWASQFGIVLATFFFLSALLCFFRWSGLTPAPVQVEIYIFRFGLPHSPVILYAICVASAVMASASHPAAVIGPLVMFFVCRWKGMRDNWTLWALTPLIVTSFSLLGIAAIARMSYRYSPEVAVIADGTGFLSAITNGSVALLELLAARPTTFSLPGAPISTSGNASYVSSALVGSLAITVSLWFARKRIGAAWFATWALFFFICVSGILVSGSTTGNYLAYLLGVPGVVAVACLMYIKLAGLKASVGVWQVPATGASLVFCGILIVGLGFLSAVASPSFGSEIGFWGDVVERRPNSVTGLKGLASASLKIGDGGAAIKLYERALAIDPGDAESVLGLGRAYWIVGQHDQSTKFYASAIRLRPNTLSIRLAYADALAQTKNLVEAVDQYFEVLKIDPDNEVAHTNLGALAMDYGKPDKAEMHFRHLLEVNPNSIPARINLANLQLKAGKLDYALNQISEVLKRDQANERAYVLAGIIVAACGDLKRAETFCRAALSINPSSSEAAYNLGCTLAAQGRNGEAAISYNRALAIKPDSPIYRAGYEAALKSQVTTARGAK